MPRKSIRTSLSAANKLRLPLSGADNASAASRQESPSLAAALTGLAASPGVFAYWLVDGRFPFDLTLARISAATMNIFQTPEASPSFLALAVGLLVYVIGLIAPLCGPGMSIGNRIRQ